MKRLFDIVENNAALQPESIMFGYKSNGSWQKMQYKDVLNTLQNMASGLLDIIGTPESYTPEAQTKIGIISQNCPLWVISDLAVQQAGAILTPIYPTVGLPDLEFILKDADIKILFVQNQDIYQRFKEVLDAASHIRIYSFEAIEGVTHIDTLSQQAKSDEARKRSIAAITEETLATIIYTSGTTGKPKGVMLSHKNIMSNVRDTAVFFSFCKSQDLALSFLPLNHIFERTVTYIYLNKNVQIYYAESMETIGENLREVHPSVFTCVPRVLEKVYEKIVSKGVELKGVKKSLFFWALNLGKKYDNHVQGNVFYKLQLKLANKIIFSKWREALGGNVKAIISGSAALQPRLIRIFTAAEVIIMEGYGLTETSPVISVNTYENEGRRIGTVGPVIDNVTVKLAEDGEILVKGDNVMVGYYKNLEMTAAEMTEDGFLKTGDIGTWVEKKFLKITDRKKEIFKTSGGKYVAPQMVENTYRESILINQIMVVGAGQKYVSALIVPDWEFVSKKWNKGSTYTLHQKEELIADKKLQDWMMEEIEKLNPKINHVEQVKKFILLPQEWSIENGLLTPKLSIRRKKIDERYAKEIGSIYGE